MTNYSFSSVDLLFGLAVFALVIVGLIMVFRVLYSRKSNQDLTHKYQGKKWRSPLEARNKYPDVDVFRLSPVFLRVGLIGSLAIAIGAFNWTNYEKVENFEPIAYEMDADIEIDVPRSKAPPPPPPPPPPPVIEEVPEGVMIEDMEDIEFVDQSVDASTAIFDTEPIREEVNAAPPPPPPPPPPMEDNMKEIFVVVEDMPTFPGCSNLPDRAARKACSDEKLMAFLYENVSYPDIARENGVEGTVVVQFVVNTDGSITDMRVLRDIGGGCGDEALRLVAAMNELPERWTPGKQRGMPVRVMYTLPIRFKLNYND